MSTVLRADPKFNIQKSDGTPASGWKVYTYDTGTVVNRVTYKDADKVAQNTNPIILDSRGEADVWWDGIYKVRVTDDADVDVYTVDNYGQGEQGTSTASGENLQPNGSFEVATAGIPDDWTLVEYTGSTNAVDTTENDHGAQSMKFTSTGSGGGNLSTQTKIPISPLSTYKLAFSLKCSVVDVRVRAEIRWLDASSVFISSGAAYDESAANPLVFTRQINTLTPPATARYAKIRIYGAHSSNPTPGSVWFDDVQLTSSASFILDVPVLSKSADYTVTTGDKGRLIRSSGTDVTLTLPAAASAGDGFTVAIKRDTDGVTTVDGFSAETIDGAITYTLGSDGASVLLSCDGTNWFTFGTGGSAGASGGGSDAVFYENDQSVTADYTITSGKNAHSAGPITIDTGITVTVLSGSSWVIS